MYNILAGRAEGKAPYGNSRFRENNNIKMPLTIGMN
jgi:hypothetical protein